MVRPDTFVHEILLRLSLIVISVIFFFMNPFVGINR